METIDAQVTGKKVGAAGRPAGRRNDAQAEDCLTYTVPQAGRLLGIGRNAAYEAAATGKIPVVKIGKLLRVPKLALQRMLDVERDTEC